MLEFPASLKLTLRQKSIERENEFGYMYNALGASGPGAIISGVA